MKIRIRARHQKDTVSRMRCVNKVVMNLYEFVVTYLNTSDVMKTSLAFICLLCLFASQPAFAQKEDKKNAKISKKEEERYQKDLKDHPNSADPHWRHANNVAAFKFKESEDAWKYYQKALEIDSMKAAIWVDFGNYMYDVMRYYADALY